VGAVHSISRVEPVRRRWSRHVRFASNSYQIYVGLRTTRCAKTGLMRYGKSPSLDH
jgi:hypothetical protein